MLIGKAAQDDHAVAEQKWQASISKAERIRSRLEAEIARHTDSIRGLTEENARLRSTIEVCFCPAMALSATPKQPFA